MLNIMLDTEEERHVTVEEDQAEGRSPNACQPSAQPWGHVLTIPKAVLEKLLNHVTSAARLIGHLDDPSVGPLADHVDTMVHDLTELLGDPHTFTGSSAAADDRVVPDGAPLLTAGTGGAR